MGYVGRPGGGVPGAACNACTARPPGADMDYGPFLTGSLDLDPAVSARHARESTEQTGDNPNNLAAKAVNVRLRAGDVEATVAFDTDLLRYAAGWTGGFVNLDKTHLTTEKGTVPLTPAAPASSRSRRRAACPAGRLPHGGDAFKDPRPRPFGPLPKRWGGTGDSTATASESSSATPSATPTCWTRRAWPPTGGHRVHAHACGSARAPSRCRCWCARMTAARTRSSRPTR